MQKKALLTGITGQHGSYLTELLIGKGYEVHGVIRRASTFNTDRTDHLYQDPQEWAVKMRMHYGDLTDGSQIARLFRTVEPDETYNLAGQLHVAVTFQQPDETGDADGLGVIPLLEAIRVTEQVGAPTVEVRGTGTPRHELLHADDLADATICASIHYTAEQRVNVGVGELNGLGWTSSIGPREGIADTYRWFVRREASVL